MAWVTRLNGLGMALIVAMPILGRWFDPAPPLDLTARSAGGEVSLVFDILAAASHRAWMLPMQMALITLVAALGSGACLYARFGKVPGEIRAARLTFVWLGVAILLSAVLDQYLPEFVL